MHFIDASQLDRLLSNYPAMVAELKRAFAENCNVPPRSYIDLAGPGSDETRTLLTMPAWVDGERLGVKVITVYPANGRHGRATINGVYMLFDHESGEPVAIVDGAALTARRTAAVAALATALIAPPEASIHLIVGTGTLSAPTAIACAAMRPFSKTLIWGRAAARREDVASALVARGLEAAAVADLPGALAIADVVTTLTSASEPIVEGRHLRPRAHVNLMGSFTPSMREADDEVLAGAAIIADDVAASLKSGELASPLLRDVADATSTLSLAEVCRSTDLPSGRAGRTVFKSVGTALADLAVAALAVDTLMREAGRA